MTYGVILNILNNEETKDANSFNEEDEERSSSWQITTSKSLKTNGWCTESLHIRVFQALTSKNSNLKRQ